VDNKEIDSEPPARSMKYFRKKFIEVSKIYAAIYSLKIYQFKEDKSMVIGITMIKTAPNQEKAGFDVLREIKGVREIYNLFGEFDLFLILEALDRAGLNLLLEEIQDQKYVLDTWPLLVSSEESLPEVKMAFSHMGEIAMS
jgi:hypothetical protein